ncbi:hypothetical protein TNCV_210171 [Trichonephila clavipes]|uniref:Uncharacterized protein n=1 Tax=Trichonephila clavipes TaxID=2585209 RepID=A0A8X6SZR9_TRICX|nr:hypothetical protein TNCV_210171 [Trichonephila clavipes]
MLWVSVYRKKCHQTSCKSGVSLLSEGRPRCANLISITAENESRFVTKDDLVSFYCSLIPSCATPLQTEASVSGCDWQHA